MPKVVAEFARIQTTHAAKIATWPKAVVHENRRHTSSESTMPRRNVLLLLLTTASMVGELKRHGDQHSQFFTAA